MASAVGTVMRFRDALEARSARVPFKVKLAVVWLLIITVLSWTFLNYGFDIPFMRKWAPYITEGAPLTVFICVSAIILACVLAFVGALGRLSKNPIAVGVSSFYVSFIRGTPLIVQIFFVYLGLPQFARFAPPELASFFILTSVQAGVIALGVNYGAYMTEIFRAGIQSVGHGQVEAAQALAMSRGQTMRRIVLPQAIRVIIPPTGNEFIAMLKDSALVGLVGTQELFYRAQKVGQQNFRIMETLVVAAAFYWLLTSIFSYFQSKLERKMATGYVRQPHGH
jgi:polar amino acid transport system permease protein